MKKIMSLLRNKYHTADLVAFEDMSKDCMVGLGRCRKIVVIISNIISNVVQKSRYIFNKLLRIIKLKNDDMIYVPRSETEGFYIPKDDGSFEKCTKEEFFDFIRNLDI